jgi:hypothetical protein
MTEDYPYKVEQLEKNFQNILVLNKDIDNIKEVMDKKLKSLKDVHSLMSKCNNKQVFLFSLDSFYFQYKSFAMELEHLNKFDNTFKNRTYCDYYKLYKLMVKYINDHNDDLKIQTDSQVNIPVYKDLEPFYDYGTDNTVEVHNIIMTYIKKIHNVIDEKSKLVAEYTSKSHLGYSISNFVNTLTHENNILKGQLDLYINYITFFHLSQQKQIKRLHSNYKDFDKEVELNLSSDHAFNFNDLLDTIDTPCKKNIKSIPATTDIDVIQTQVIAESMNEMKQLESEEIPSFSGISSS